MNNPYEKLHIIVGDITKVKVDAIVNAANNSLLGGGGVDGAIHRAAGKKLLQECRALNGCNTGSCKITRGYDLPASYIIHAVGPIYRDGKHGEPQSLTSCYHSALELVLDKHLTSVAFSCISCGIYGYPMQDAANLALDEILYFFDEVKEDAPDVYIVCYSQADADIYNKVYADMLKQRE